jgi:hypothetical protein
MPARANTSRHCGRHRTLALSHGLRGPELACCLRPNGRQQRLSPLGPYEACGCGSSAGPYWFGTTQTGEEPCARRHAFSSSASLRVQTSLRRLEPLPRGRTQTDSSALASTCSSQRRLQTSTRRRPGSYATGRPLARGVCSSCAGRARSRPRPGDGPGPWALGARTPPMGQAPGTSPLPSGRSHRGRSAPCARCSAWPCRPWSGEAYSRSPGCRPPGAPHPTRVSGRGPCSRTRRGTASAPLCGRGSSRCHPLEARRLGA